MERGERYLADGNLQKAQIEFRNALQIDPSSAETRVMIGRVDEQLGDLRAAAGMYQSAIDLDPGDVEARARLGKIYVLGGVASRALDLVRPALAKHPADAQLLTVRGMARAALKDLGAARADAERAVQLAPNDENAVALLASIEVSQSEPQRAVDLVQAALARTPASIDLRQVLADLYGRVGEPQLAEAQLSRIVALRPKDLASRYRLALFYAGAKRLDEADRALRDAIALRPGEDGPKLTYVQFLLRYRSPADAERALEEFLKRDAGDDDLRLALGDVQQRQGDLDGALSTYRQVVVDAGEHPRGLTARDRIAAIEVTQGRLDEAARLVAAVLQDEPRDSDALLLRANIAMERHDPATAIVNLRAVLRDQPRSIPLKQALAAAYRANGQTALAEETLRSALDIAPDSVSALSALASIEVGEGHTQEALDRVRSAARSQPSSAALQNLLGEAYLAARDYPSAIATLDQATRLASKWWVPYRNLASAQAASGDTAGAIHTYERGLAAAGLEPALVGDLAALYEREGRTDEAIREYEALYQRDPQLPFAANNLAMLLVTYRKDRASLDRAGSITARFLASENPDLLDTAGWVCLKRGELGEQGALGEALSALQKAAQRAPDSRVIRYHLGMAQLEAGQRDRARSSLEAALAGSARFEGWQDARSALASLQARAG